MINRLRIIYFFLLVSFFILTISGYAQCTQVNIIGGENPLLIQYDGNGRLTSISGTDEEEGAKTIRFEVNKGLVLPQKGQKSIGWADNGDGTIIITMGDGDDDESMHNQIKINKDGKIIYWVLAQEGGLKTTNYTYDKNGDLLKMTWGGGMDDTKVTDKGELVATFNTAKPDIIMKGAPMVFLAEMPWQMFPMTNSHQITRFTYNQTIHIPESKEVTGYDKQGNEIYKMIPAKDIKNVITRNFSYGYDGSGRPSSITVTGSGIKSTNFKITYTSCIKID